MEDVVHYERVWRIVRLRRGIRGNRHDELSVRRGGEGDSGPNDSRCTDPGAIVGVHPDPAILALDIDVASAEGAALPHVDCGRHVETWALSPLKARQR